MNTKKRVLWIDDDKIKDRLIFFEEMVIRRKLGWKLDMVTNLTDAADYLSQNDYDAIILDQGLPQYPVADKDIPMYTPQSQNNWMGIVLLYWLKTAPSTWFEDKDHHTLQAYQTLISSGIKPSAHNIDIPIMILSVQEQERIEAGCKNLENFLNSHNKSKLEISIKGKPVTESKITQFLRQV